MLFVMFATAYPERYSDLFHLLKHMRIPEGVKIVKKLELFRKVGNVSTHLAKEVRE